jgi:hypothetical protein
MTALTTLWLKALASLTVLHRVAHRTKAASRHSDTYKVRGILFDSLCVLFAFAD